MSAKARLFTLNRNFTIHSKFGHDVRFLKGEPVLVPPLLFHEVLAIGAVAHDGADAIAEVEETKQPEMSDQDRGKTILAAVELIAEGNVRTDFTAGGTPTAKAVGRVTGFDVFTREVNIAWQEFHDKKAAEKAAA